MFKVEYEYTIWCTKYLWVFSSEIRKVVSSMPPFPLNGHNEFITLYAMLIVFQVSLSYQLRSSTATGVPLEFLVSNKPVWRFQQILRYKACNVRSSILSLLFSSLCLILPAIIRLCVFPSRRGDSLAADNAESEAQMSTYGVVDCKSLPRYCFINVLGR